MTKKKISSEICFGVITKIEGDNYAVEEILVNPDGNPMEVGANLLVGAPIDETLFVEAIKFRDAGNTTIDLTKRQMLFCQSQVFGLGEIMVLESKYGRTIPDGRKPSKWFVEYETFSKIEDAIKRAKEVVGDS